MLEDARQHLAKKAKQLDLGRSEALQSIQKILDTLYPSKTHAKSLNEGVLKITTESSAIASEIRLNQVKLIKEIHAVIGYDRPIARLHINIESL